jgi:hypothetical protein
MYSIGKTRFKHKEDYQAYLLQGILNQLEYLATLNLHTYQKDVCKSIAKDSKRILKTIDSPLKNLSLIYESTKD